MRTPSACLRQGGALFLLGTVPYLVTSCSDSGTDDGGASGAPGVAGAPAAGGGAPAVAGANAGGVVATAGSSPGGAAAGVGGSAAGSGAGGSPSGASGAPTAGTSGAAASAGGGAGGSGGAGGGAGGASGGAGVAGASGAGGTLASGGAGTGGSSSFALTSPNHMEGAKFADKYTCANGGFEKSEMPALQWGEPPAGTKSFAITFIDVTLTKKTPPDANGYHWVLYDIPASTRMLKESFKAADAAALMAKQSRDFLGPCPNFGGGGAKTDTYEFTIYALAEESITLSGTRTQDMTKDAETKLEAMNLAKAKLSGTSDASP